MNILHYTGMPYSTKYGGFEKWIIEFAKIANSYNYDTFVSYTEKIEDIPNLNNDFIKNGIKIIVTKNRDNTILLKQIEDNNIDVFISHFSEPYLEAQFVAKRTKCKVFSFFHCYNYYTQLSWRFNFKEKLVSTLYRWLVFKSQFYINHFFAVSNAVKCQYSQYCFILPNKISTIYLGVPQKKWSENSQQKYNKRHPIITCIACHGDFKGIDILIEAAKILKERNLKFKILQVGGGMIFNNGEDTRFLHDLVIKYNLSDCFEWLGVRNNINEILQQSNIYVQPSRREAISLTIAEAMMHKLPIIASNTDGIPEYIIDNETGVLYNNNNPVELANKIECLINDFGNAKRLGVNAYNYITSKKFNMKLNILNFINNYIISNHN